MTVPAPKSWPRLASGVQARRRTSTASEPPQKLATGPFSERWELHIDALRVCPRAHSGRLAGDGRVDDGDVVASLAASCSAMTPEERAERRRAARGARERLPGTSGRGIHAGRCCVRAAGQACPGACRPWTAALVGLRWSCEVSVERFFRCLSPSTAVCGVDPSRLLMWRCPMHVRYGHLAGRHVQPHLQGVRLRRRGHHFCARRGMSASCGEPYVVVNPAW